MAKSNPLFDPADRPDQAFVSQGLTYMREKVWQPAWDKWSVTDSYILQTYKVWGDDKRFTNRSQTTTSTAYSRVTHAVNNLMASTPKVHCEPAGKGRIHEERADAKEKGLSAILIDAAFREAIPTYRTINLNLIRYDYAVYHGPVLEPRITQPKPRKRSGEDPEDFTNRMEAWEAAKEVYNPIRIRAPHPRSVMMDPVDKDPMFAFMVTARTGFQIARLLANKRLTREGVADVDLEGKMWDDQMALIEFWTPYWHWVGLGDRASNSVARELYLEPNGPGFLPFKHTWGGHGGEFTDDEGIRTDHLGGGLIGPIIEDLKRESQELSAEHNILIENAWGKVMAPPQMDTAEAAQALEGDVIPPGYSYLPPPSLAPGIQNLSARTDAQIERATFTMGLAGFKQANTVGQESLLTQAAMRGFEMPRMMAEQVASLMAADLLRLVDYYGKVIKARGATLDPTDIERLYQADVTFTVVDPILRLQERELTMKEVMAGLASKKNYMHVKGIEAAQDEIDEIDADRARQDPAYIEMVNAQVYRKDGLEQLAKLAEEKASAIIAARRKQMEQGAAIGGTQPQLGGPADMADMEAGSEIQPGGAQSLRRAAPGAPQASAMANGQQRRGMEAMTNGRR